MKLLGSTSLGNSNSTLETNLKKLNKGYCWELDGQYANKTIPEAQTQL